MRRGTAVIAAGVVAVLVVVSVALAYNTFVDGSADDARQPKNVAVVWGNPIPGSLFRQGVAVRAAAQQDAGAALRAGSAAYRRVQDDTLRQLVSDVTVVAEARRQGLVKIDGAVAVYVVGNPADLPRIWQRLYGFAARMVPEPRDADVVHAVHLDQDALGQHLTTRELHEYYKWQADRDRVASAWFGRLFRRYRAHTTYAPGFRPAPT
jgi:hypothetical protein